MKKDTTLYNTGKDLFGNDYGPQTVDTIPQVPAAAWMFFRTCRHGFLVALRTVS